MCCKILLWIEHMLHRRTPVPEAPGDGSVQGCLRVKLFTKAQLWNPRMPTVSVLAGECLVSWVAPTFCVPVLTQLEGMKKGEF